MKQVIHFLLVPDSGASRRLRRLIAEQAACSDVLIGTWQELLTQAENAYLIPKQDNSWDEIFQNALNSLPDAFWAKSIEVSPQETSGTVQEALTSLLSASDIKDGVPDEKLLKLAQRSRKHIHDLLELHATIGQLPPELAVIDSLLNTPVDYSIRQLQVYTCPESMLLTKWQMALIDKLNHDSGKTPNVQLQALLDSLFEIKPVTTSTSLNKLQKDLFLPTTDKVALDESLQWIGVRDHLEEAEIAAGMVQQLLLKDKTLQPSDIGILLPQSFEYSLALENTFNKAGLVTSGLTLDRWQKDLGREAVFHFLHCRKRPAPAMALAVCLSSPLMPWTREQGGKLAQTLMDGNYALKPPAGASKNTRKMLDLLRSGDEKPDTLIFALMSFLALLDGGDDWGHDFSAHIDQAKITVEKLIGMLESMSDIHWTSLRRVATPKNISTSATPDFNQEGVTIWREGYEPWREVRTLFVLGFASGHYPQALGVSPVFAADDLNNIRQHLNLPMATPADELKLRRDCFKRQLGLVTDSVTFLIPRRSSTGESISPSETLVFMHQLIDQPENTEAGDLIQELDSEVGRQRIRDLAITAETQASPPREIVSDDLNFDRDLLTLRLDAEGNPKPESPSGLETLMVSRLAWLLSRIKAEPLGWEPERPDVLILGTVAHEVFENLFKAGEAVPTQNVIDAQVGPILDEAISQNAPFLRAAQWQVERRHLHTSIAKAAQAWRTMLESLNAEVLATEEYLHGKLNGVGIHGQVDVILTLSDGRMLVIDYKRSSSKGRRERMQKGYDSQASLYRTMLQSGGPKDKENKSLIENIANAESTGIVYYMMNDQTALSESLLLESGSIPGWDIVKGDVASGAIALIEHYLAEIQQGQVTLNRAGDAVFLENTAKVKPYALENSPLISLFTRSDDSKSTKELT
ncbi:MAG: hypothetical protein HKN87_22330 [Saprospiraceae bacterium]|nr:hypothetical protein [Saprospiraceae bacterium]